MYQSKIEQLHAAKDLLVTRLSENEYARHRYNLPRMARCQHLPGMLASHCGLRLCPVCERWRNELANISLKYRLHSLHSAGKTRFLFATATLEDVKTASLGQDASHQSSSWNRLMKKVPSWKGDFRVTEISPSTADPSKEHLHAHGIIAVSPSAYSGRDYRSKKNWPEAWNKDWDKAAGETASTLDVKRVPDNIDDIDHIIDYCLPFGYESRNGRKGWLQQAEDAIADPERHVERAVQLSGLHRCRYRGELDPKRYRPSEETGLCFSDYANSKWSKVVYQCDPHRKKRPRLFPIAHRAAQQAA
jgi:hypothetical protein